MLVGLVCVLISATSLVRSRSERRQFSSARTGAQHWPTTQIHIDRATQARQWRQWLLTAGALTIVFLVASLALARFRRRLMAKLFQKPHPPTPVEDVWQMHKLPEGFDEDDEPLVPPLPEDEP